MENHFRITNVSYVKYFLIADVSYAAVWRATRLPNSFIFCDVSLLIVSHVNFVKMFAELLSGR
jgi:hypothetical protein